jgi:hypothetical protein
LHAPLQIVNRAQDTAERVTEAAKADIAAVADPSSKNAGLVVVVQAETFLAVPRLGFTAALAKERCGPSSFR